MTSKEFSKAAGILQEGITELEGRQKLLKIADKSEHGWLTVEEYVGDKDLASDEENAKRIRKAEKQADRKSKKLTVFNRGRPYNIPNKFFDSNHVAYQHQNSQSALPYRSWFFRRQMFGNFKRFQTTDICFKCWEQGHWARFCKGTNGTDTANSNSSSPLPPSRDSLADFYEEFHSLFRQGKLKENIQFWSRLATSLTYFITWLMGLKLVDGKVL